MPEPNRNLLEACGNNCRVRVERRSNLGSEKYESLSECRNQGWVSTDQIILASQEHHSIVADNGLSDGGRNSRLTRPFVNPPWTLPLECCIVGHKTLFFIDEPVASGDDLTEQADALNLVRSALTPLIM
jgi:hypothetical protein